MAAIGVDVGGTKQLAVLLGDDGTVVAESRRRTPHGADAVVAGIVSLVDELRAGVPTSVSVGVGVPGLVTRAGALRAAPNLTDTVDVPVRARLEHALGMPVAVDNDNTCATMAEWRLGAGAGARDVVFVGLGTGIGGGFVADGRLQRGHHGFAGEFGHMVLVPDGEPCVCGRRGCWERYASGSALAAQARRAAAAGMLEGVTGGGEGLRGEDVVAAARSGHRGAVTVLDDFARWVAFGVTNLVHATDPEVVVIGGGLVEDAALWLPSVRRHVDALLYAPGLRPRPPVVPAALGERAGAVGAALLGREATRTA